MSTSLGLGRLWLDGFPGAGAVTQGWGFSRGWEVAARRDPGWGKGKTSFFSVSEGGLSGAFLVS